jgi:hypothetical protein
LFCFLACNSPSISDRPWVTNLKMTSFRRRAASENAYSATNFLHNSGIEHCIQKTWGGIAQIMNSLKTSKSSGLMLVAPLSGAVLEMFRADHAQANIERYNLSLCGLSCSNSLSLFTISRYSRNQFADAERPGHTSLKTYTEPPLNVTLACGPSGSVLTPVDALTIVRHSSLHGQYFSYFTVITSQISVAFRHFHCVTRNMV